MNYYNVLGINKTASQDEIKRAFKKAAMKHHPDRGGNEETFKHVTEAYEILGNAEKRQEYDNPQPKNDFHFNSQHNPFGRHPFGDIFNQMYQQRRQPQNRDIRINLVVEFEDAFYGKIVTASYQMANGKTEFINVQVPVGANDGDTVRYKGLGDNTDPRVGRGDLYVKIRVRLPAGWQRQGNDLVTKKFVNVFDIMLGCVILIETPDKKSLNLNIPKGTKSGTTLAMRGYGMSDVRTGRKGSILVQIEAQIPRINDPDVIAKTLELKHLIEDKKNG